MYNTGGAGGDKRAWSTRGAGSQGQGGRGRPGRSSRGRSPYLLSRGSGQRTITGGRGGGKNTDTSPSRAQADLGRNPQSSSSYTRPSPSAATTVRPNGMPRQNADPRARRPLFLPSDQGTNDDDARVDPSGGSEPEDGEEGNEVAKKWDQRKVSLSSAADVSERQLRGPSSPCVFASIPAYWPRRMKG
jgi:hypothetical protein